jgi:hypothetical protein
LLAARTHCEILAVFKSLLGEREQVVRFPTIGDGLNIFDSTIAVDVNERTFQFRVPIWAVDRRVASYLNVRDHSFSGVNPSFSHWLTVH